MAFGWMASHLTFQEPYLVWAKVLWEVFESALGYPVFLFGFLDRGAFSILPYQPTDVSIRFDRVFILVENLSSDCSCLSREEMNTYDVMFSKDPIREVQHSQS